WGLSLYVRTSATEPPRPSHLHTRTQGQGSPELLRTAGRGTGPSVCASAAGGSLRMCRTAARLANPDRGVRGGAEVASEPAGIERPAPPCVCPLSKTGIVAARTRYPLAPPLGWAKSVIVPGEERDRARPRCPSRSASIRLPRRCPLGLFRPRLPGVPAPQTSGILARKEAATGTGQTRLPSPKRCSRSPSGARGRGPPRSPCPRLVGPFPLFPSCHAQDSLAKLRWIRASSSSWLRDRR
ncbi:hypothetical protein T484DRAFT_2961966, partial [Baffinella frigidus]